MKNVIAYCRVSTDGQVGEDKFGIDAQKAQIVTYAQKNEMQIIDWFIDEGVSGAKENRPAFDRIIYGDITNPPYEAVLVAKNDRVARDINIYYYYKMMLKKKDIVLISIAEDFGQFGVFSNMLEAFTLCVAEMERENINKRTTMGRSMKSTKGGYSGGAAPFGYTVANGRLCIAVDEAKAVKMIFEMSEKGSTLQQIADKMNELGIKTHRDGIFRTSTVQIILANRKTYQGWYCYGKDRGKETSWVQGEHEPILSDKE